MIRALCAVLLAVVLAAAQAEDPVIAVNVDLVNVYFNVCDRKGRLITHLGPETFQVFEDGIPQTVTHFSRETDLPLTIALLIDTSGSVRDKMRIEREAAVEFLNTTLRPGRDKAAIFTFDSTIDLRQDYTDNLELLSDAVRRARAGGGTFLYDSLHFLLKNIAQHEGRRGIILLTDGDDNSSRTTPQIIVEAAQRSNVAIYAVSVNAFGLQMGASERSDRILESLSAETGGKAAFPKQLKELSTYFKKISIELRSQYTIAYRSTNSKRDGTFRRIRIDVKKGHFVNARSGYYAPSQVLAGKN